MLYIEEAPTRSAKGRIGIVCNFCKNWVFNPKGFTHEGEARLEWRCIHCQATFSSPPPYETPGEDKESFKEKIVTLLLEEGNCEKVVKIFATSSKKPPQFIEEELRNLFSNL
jgi:transposase-like protein